MPRSYPYGKVPSSIATVISEKFERPFVDCGYCSGQMVIRSARAGIGTNGQVEGHRIRAAGGRPHWAGNTSSELRKGTFDAYGVSLLGISKDGVLPRVKQGFAVAVSLAYAKLPGYLKVQINDFAHCCMVKGHRTVSGVDYVGFFDPLWEQGSQGTWARWTDIVGALWSTGHSTSTTKYVPAGARYTVHIAKGATVRTYTVHPASASAPRCILRWKDATWGRAGSKASCTLPGSLRTCDGASSATVVLVTSGAFKDKTIKVDADFGVTVTEA
jgi:hypothetical protein